MERNVKDELVKTFNEVFGWFNAHQALLQFSPGKTDWNVKQVLEHISLANQYLLNFVRKGKLVDNHRALAWSKPAHSKPKGRVPIDKIQDTLQLQFKECLQHLEKHGEDTGNIDVYHNIYLLVQYARRQLMQLEKIEFEFNLGV